MVTEKNFIPSIKGSDCFACSPTNPLGLHMQLYTDGDGICSEVVLGRYHVGWQSMAHGGIISTLLDEVMSWTAMYATRRFAVTRRIQIRYLRPVPVQEPLEVCGNLKQQEKPNTCEVAAVVRNRQGKVLARGEAEFALLDPQKVADFPEPMKSEMEAVLAQLPPQPPR